MPESREGLSAAVLREDPGASDSQRPRMLAAEPEQEEACSEMNKMLSPVS